MQDRETTLRVLNWDRSKMRKLVLAKLSEGLKKQLLGLAFWNNFKNNKNKPIKAATGTAGRSPNNMTPVASLHQEDGE